MGNEEVPGCLDDGSLGLAGALLPTLGIVGSFFSASLFS
jgi:hypothetical protein